MRKDKKNNSANKCIDTTDQNQNHHQGQNSQDDVLKISISVDSIHIAKGNEVKKLFFLSFFGNAFSFPMFDKFVEKFIFGLLEKDFC
jgi:hypothetical protein